MISISVSEYQKFCINYLQEALKRPQMYFRSLEELEATMGGHAVAFGQLEAISREQAFNTCFADWIYKTKGASGAAGWAYAIKNSLDIEGSDANTVFAQLAEEFFGQWIADTSTT